jgi:dihydrolipoamide dehydrogenase
MADVVILGGGIAGMKVALDVAAGGKSVTLVEAGLVGGESPYLACVPSNSLLRSARAGQTWENAAGRRDAMISWLDDSPSAARLADAGVELVRGPGRIAGPGQVEANGEIVGYQDLVIAAGSEPMAPPVNGLSADGLSAAAVSGVPVWTSAQALTCPSLPRRLIILGGGAAGCELAQIYGAFGTKVTLVEAADRLLPAEPAFVGEFLARTLRRTGVDVRTSAFCSQVAPDGHGIALSLAGGAVITADRLLLACGRRPRLTGLGLDRIGIDVPPGGPLPVDGAGRVMAGTGGECVWAAGDVTGTGHTHVARYQARVVAENILRAQAAAPGSVSPQALATADYRALPRTVHTDPQVFAVGLTPQAACMAGLRLRVAGAPLAGTIRATIDGAAAGYVELYAEADSGVLAGAAAVGPDAADWMAETTLAVRARIPVTMLADVVRSFPSHGEVLEGPLRELVGQAAATGAAIKVPAARTAAARTREVGR